MKLHEEKNWKSLYLTYEIHDDKLKIQSILPFYWYNIPFENIENLEVRSPPVIWDIIKRRKEYWEKYWLGFRSIKNDLADLSKHITVIKKTGFWKEIRITPQNPERFKEIFDDAQKKGAPY